MSELFTERLCAKARVDREWVARMADDFAEIERAIYQQLARAVVVLGAERGVEVIASDMRQCPVAEPQSTDVALTYAVAWSPRGPWVWLYEDDGSRRMFNLGLIPRTEDPPTLVSTLPRAEELVTRVFGAAPDEVMFEVDTTLGPRRYQRAGIMAEDRAMWAYRRVT